MFERNILDCTLRDGGYINNWGFTNNMTKLILKSLISANVEYIECGYISNTKSFGEESTYFQSFEQIDKLIKESFQEVKTDFRPTFCIMLNRGEYDVNEIPDYQEGSDLTDIRFAFHKRDLHAAFEDAKILLDKGYQVFAQPMVTQLYSDFELLETIELFNSIAVKALYIVDSFGNMTTETFKRLMYLFHNNMRPDLQLGYHSHNNLQLAFSNAIAFLEAEIKRDIYLDSSIFGMGRGAGNLNTELVASHLNTRYTQNYHIEPLLETMDSYLHKLHETNYWGYSIEHYLSASLSCHPNSATYLLQKKNLTIVEIEKILSALPYEQRNKFDKEVLDKKVLEYLNESKSKVNDLLQSSLSGFTNALVIGSGPNIVDGVERVKEIKSTIDSLVTISLNHVFREVDCDYYFFSNQKRYKEFELVIPSDKLIVSSNIQLANNHSEAIVLDFKGLYDDSIAKTRNISVLLMNYFSKKAEIKNVYLAGLDGYDLSGETKYSYVSSNSLLDKEVMKDENEQIGTALLNHSASFSYTFLTQSIFQKLLPLRVCGVIPARFKSSRFEGKPLAEINGIPMIKRTYLQAKKSDLLTELMVATDDQKIYDYCESEGIKVVMTSDQCLTGTDRIAEVSLSYPFDLYVNIQGDEPVIDPLAIDQVVSAYRTYGEDYIAYNLYKTINSDEDETSDAMIKVIVNEEDELMYMSRSTVPFSKSGLAQEFKKQVCVYGFTAKALRLFSRVGKTQNEKFEDIEILRFLDLGYKVKMIETKSESIAVDHPEDIKKVEDHLAKIG